MNLGLGRQGGCLCKPTGELQCHVKWRSSEAVLHTTLKSNERHFSQVSHVADMAQGVSFGLTSNDGSCRSVNPHVTATLESVTASSKAAPYLPRASGPQMCLGRDEKVVSGISSFAFQV